ncbi:MAG: hypothetical protein U1E86_28565 [Burkholderiaceae bacterium]
MNKAGFLFGGQIGDGVLFEGGKVSGYYTPVAASYGLQVGGDVRLRALLHGTRARSTT